ncbi:hypothetical protein SDC9_110401 [bioreactor metagenome]|uniref:Uncharacterized protein n=1 Tax=bioreactor metagenome TaxID=1076179 RepID=A0A645BFX7_9ZZZZ
MFGDGVQQRQSLQRIAGAVGPLQEPAIVDIVLDPGHQQADAELVDHPVAVREHLGEVVPGVDMQQGERHSSGPEGFGGQVEQDGRVLAAAEQQHRPLQLGDGLADDVDGLGLQQVEMVESAHRCNPHSVLARPAHRPARGSSPGATRRVHGSQPIEG